MSLPSPSNHACFVYRDISELVSVAVPFLASGLRNGERCWYISRGDEAGTLRTALHGAGVQVTTAERRGAFRLFGPENIYAALRPFSPEDMMGVFSDAIEEALHDGFTGFRAAGEMSWSDHLDLPRPLFEYEHLISTLLCNSRARGLCLYHVDSLHGHAAVPVHPKVGTLRGELVLNPAFDHTYPRAAGKDL
ncbi:MAG TPA: MEDS domain-containing protein [Vicinamibacterales bacterium]|nr:MEDS domain-containing protein [Vicinamibacterales bacterium]